VRKSAIFAIRFRPFRPFVDAVTKAATKDEAAFVRADAVRLLSEHADDEPAHTAAIVATLTHVAAHDPSAAVRRVAFREEAP
jgi:hypothetical protein